MPRFKVMERSCRTLSLQNNYKSVDFFDTIAPGRDFSEAQAKRSTKQAQFLATVLNDSHRRFANYVRTLVIMLDRKLLQDNLRYLLLPTIF